MNFLCIALTVAILGFSTKDSRLAERVQSEEYMAVNLPENKTFLDSMDERYARKAAAEPITPRVTIRDGVGVGSGGLLTAVAMLFGTWLKNRRDR